MCVGSIRCVVLLSLFIFSTLQTGGLLGQNSAPSGSAPTASKATSSGSAKKAPNSANTGTDPGVIANSVYRNKTLGLSCKIPAGWVLRTEEMNARDENADAVAASSNENPATGVGQLRPGDGKVLLAAFSRPPDARGDDVNASILIAVESAAAYPGLKDAAQYFGPLTEVANAQGFVVDEEPYEFALGAKTLVRGDFHKDVGTRVMQQSTLAMLAHGYAVSITLIGGTEDEVEELIDGLSFAAAAKK
jgi:hypothetical protein